MEINEKNLENGFINAEQKGQIMPKHKGTLIHIGVGDEIKNMLETYMNRYNPMYKRNVEIFKMYVFEGKNMLSIGEEYSITRQRVQQIVTKYKKRFRSKNAKPLREACLSLLNDIPEEELPEVVRTEIEIRYSSQFRKLLLSFYEQETKGVDSSNVNNKIWLSLQETKKEKGRFNIKRAGVSWEKEEDEQLKSEYKEGIEIEEIAKIHKRSVRAIKFRLEKHGHMR